MADQDTEQTPLGSTDKGLFKSLERLKSYLESREHDLQEFEQGLLREQNNFQAREDKRLADRHSRMQETLVLSASVSLTLSEQRLDAKDNQSQEDSIRSQVELSEDRKEHLYRIMDALSKADVNKVNLF